jgi:hypothetical protein
MTHVDSLVIRIFQLPDPFIMIWDHPVLQRAILHTSQDQLGDLKSTSTLYWPIAKDNRDLAEKTHLETRLAKVDIGHSRLRFAFRHLKF